MSEAQFKSLNEFRAFVRFATVIAYLKRAERPRSLPLPAISDDKWFEAFEGEINLVSLFTSDAVPQSEVASDCLKSWLTPQRSNQRLIDVWKRWFSGHALAEVQLPPDAKPSKGDIKQSRKTTILPSFHELKPFTGDLYAHNVVNRFERFLRAPDEEKRPGRTGGRTVHLLEWDNYATNLVKHNGGWNEFRRRCVLEPGVLQDFLPRSCCTGGSLPAHDRDSLVSRVLALYRDRYLLVIVPATAVAWPLWLLRMLHAEPARQTESAKGVVTTMQQVIEHGDGPLPLRRLLAGGDEGKELYVDLSLQPGLLRGLPYPFGLVDKAMDEIEPSPNSKVEGWQLAWFTPLCKKLFQQSERSQWSPPILVCHRSELNEEGVRRYIIATDPCQIFASVFKIGDFTEQSFSVWAQNGTWADHTTERFPPRSRNMLSRDNFFRESARAPQEQGNGLFLSSFPSDLLLRAGFSPLERDQIYKLPLQPEHQKQLDYTLSGTAFFGGEHLASQAKMVPLLRDFGCLMADCKRLLRGCVPTLTDIRVKDYVHVAPAQREMKAKELASSCADLTETKLPRNIPARNLVRQVLTEIGRDMGSHLCPVDLRQRFDALMEAWGWAHLLEITYCTNIAFDEALFTEKL